MKYFTTNTQKKHLSKFEINELLGREALRELMSDSNQELEEIRFTEDQYAVYDARWKYRDSAGKERYAIVEIKIRNAVYPDYILEAKKLASMSRVGATFGLDPKDVSLFYINFCPDATYLWNITNVQAKYDAKCSRMNKTTSVSTTKKVEKTVYYLPTSTAMRFDYVLNREYLTAKIL